MTGTDVLVVGAGPVGLLLAIDLAQRGVNVEVVERNDAPRFLPKMERSNARTMEILRRLGLADRVRAASRFSDVPMDVFVVTNLAEPPLVHLPYPSAIEAKRLSRDSTDGSLPLEPYQLISQYTLEPLLVSVLDELPNARVRFSTELTDFVDSGDEVRAGLKTADGDDEVTCRYLVGCDGGASAVRRGLGIKLEGEGQLRRVHQVFFRSPELFDRIPMGKGRHYWSTNGSIVVQDDLEHFMLNVFTIDDNADPADVVRDFIGFDVDLEVLHISEWQFNLLLATSYGQGRVFLAGDAVHLLIPTGGLGMNTGVGDAINLSWKLAAAVAGWGGGDLLASYEAERRPIAQRNIGASKMAAENALSWQLLAGGIDLRVDSAEAHEAKPKVAAAAAVGQRVMYEMHGIELGYEYSDSPIVCADARYSDPGPMTYVPSTSPGARLPNVWLQDGTSVLDLLGPDYTLLKLDPTLDTEAFEKALAASGVPAQVLDLSDASARRVYKHKLMLLRPDLHVAWRGDQAPEQAADVVDVVVGRMRRDR